jgi:sensor histidine kinase YesM
MPKEGDKNLLIKVSNANENQKNCVKITIDDNGIGMKKSIEKRKTNLKHKSVGMSIVNERIKEFNKNKNAQISTKIFDKDEIGETGTFVELMIENQI